jgi:hypothetical protein
MRSMNVRRVAAVAAGAAMIGSVMASGFAAVNQQGDVAKLVDDIKANLNDVAIVLGSNGADISDGIAAAKLAAALAMADFTATTPTATTSGGAAGGVTVTGTKVTVSSGSGVLETTSSDSWKEEYTQGNVTGMGDGYSTTVTNKSITYQMLTKLLQQRTLKPTINSTAYSISYEDQINLYYGQVRYDESTSPTTSAHALYFRLPTSIGVRGERGLTYRVNFGGNGLPIGSATNQNYQNWPEVYILGDKITIDPVNTASGKLVLGTGAQYTVSSGESVTSGDYTIKIDAIGQTSSETGVTLQASFTVTKTNTSEPPEKGSATAGNSATFFNEAVRVTVQSITGNTAILRVGVGTATFTTDQAWTLNGGTSANTQWILENVSVTGNYLNAIILRYGNPTNTGMKYDFSGTYLTGLAANTVLNGPLTSAGTPYFKVQLKGFGSKSTAVDTTKVTLEGQGRESDLSNRLRTKWTSRDGTENDFNPDGFNYTSFAVSNPVALLETNLTIGTYAKRWTIVNDKVVYLESATLQSGSTTLYDAVFRIGSPTGTAVTVSGINATQSGHFRYDSAVNPIFCDVWAHTTNSINMTVSASYAATMAVGTDATTGACDMYPDVVQIGLATTVSPSATNNPFLDMRFVNGYNATPVTNFSGVCISGCAGVLTTAPTMEPWPFVTVYENASDYFAVVLDADDTTGADVYYGVRVYNATQNATGYLNMSNAATYINLAQSNPADNSKYQITRKGSELSTTGNYLLEATIPETARNNIVEVAADIAASNATTGDQVLTSFPATVSGVTIKSVDVTTSATNATAGTCAVNGTYYAKAATVQPKSLVISDVEAEGSDAYLIVVGGPWVNRIAAGMADSSLTTEVGAQYLIATDKKLLAAGYSATDTAAAADELIDLLVA